MIVEIGNEAAQFPEKEIQKWKFRCSAILLLQSLLGILLITSQFCLTKTFILRTMWLKRIKIKAMAICRKKHLDKNI
jgi:hypothetical protein